MRPGALDLWQGSPAWGLVLDGVLWTIAVVGTIALVWSALARGKTLRCGGGVGWRRRRELRSFVAAVTSGDFDAAEAAARQLLERTPRTRSVGVTRSS